MKKTEKKGNHLAVKMAIAMVLGLICGLAMLMLRENLLTSGQTQTWAAINNLLFQDITAEAGKNAIGLFYIVGQLFVNALQVIIVPMIFCSIALAICQITDTRKLGRISSKTLGTFLLTTAVALVIAGAVGLTVYATGAFNAVEVSGLNVSTGSSGSAAKASDSSKKVGLIGLVGIVISAMIGGGIYNLPQNMAADASAGAIIIAWVVTGIGIWFIANTFRILSAARPELTNGLYTYAEKGFGKLIGFFVAYGYWICNCFALVAYSVLVMATLNYFVPDFSGGNNIPSIIGGSIITWIMYLLALQGAKSTSFLNIIGTIGKLLPVAIFIIAVATVFKFSVFMEGFWGMKGAVDLTFSWDNVMPQVQATMLVTLWLFLGIEGAVVVSGKAKSQAAVRKATTIGFLVTLALYIIVSLLPLGVYSQADVGAMADPSMAAIMLDKFGKWGEILVNAGVIVSVLSSWLVWMLMLGEMPLAASKSGIFPKAFVKENKKGSPSTALLWTTIIVQIVLVISFFIGSNAWTTMISITSVMALPCYLFCTLFLFKIAIKKEYPKGIFASRNMAVFTGAAGSLYGLWLIYAAGLNYLMVACIVYAVGLPLYIVGVRQHDPKAKLFAKTSDKIIVAVVVALGIAGLIYSIVTFGHVKL